MDLSQAVPANLSPSTRAHDDNPRKRGRTACSRCKTRKQKCDSLRPVCSSCRKAGAPCDLIEIQGEETMPIRYTRALEDRIAYLEIQLSQIQPATPTTEDGERISTRPPNAHPQNALGEVVDFLTLGHFEAPAYVGSSSGLSLALNLGDMVQATVWNKALSTSNENMPRGDGDSEGYESSSAIQGNPITMDDLLTKSAGPPSEEEGRRMVNTYLTQIHPRYPFLDRHELWTLHDARATLTARQTQLSKSERYGIFKLYLVYAIGAMLIRLTDKNTTTSPESYYMTALQHIHAARESRSIRNIEAMTLLVIYHLRSSSSHGLWYMIGLAMRTCVDLGLHRKLHEAHLDPGAIQQRRRLFWTVYCLERVISITLGRPSSVADRHIDLELPSEYSNSPQGPAESTGQAPSIDRPIQSPTGTSGEEDFSYAIYFCRLRRIESQIQHSVYRVDQPLSKLLHKIPDLFNSLEQLRAWLTSRDPPWPDLNYPLLHYNRAIRLLIQPFLSILPVTDPYYQSCLRSAGAICQAHKRLHQRHDYGHSFIAVQTVFVAGITMLYCLWTHTNTIWSIALSNDIRACSLVLFAMSERTGWVKKYRDAFELLVTATMEKLQGNSVGNGGIVETAAAVALTDIDFGPLGEKPGLNETNQFPPTSTGQGMNLTAGYHPPEERVDASNQYHGDAMRVINELANWIDQEGDVPVWMPEFESLENLADF